MSTLVVDVAPIGKARARMGRRGRVFTPQKTVDAEREIAAAWRLRGLPVHVGALSIHVDAEFAVPPSTSKRERERRLNGSRLHTQKPDWDNVAKLVCDALNGVAYGDDSGIAIATTRKRWAEYNRITITVTEAA